MRNLLVLVVTILTIVNMRCGDNIERSISAQNPPELNDEQKPWLIALPAIIMEVNKSSHVTLEVKPISEASIQKYKTILEKWWGVTNRSELLNAIRSLEMHGTNATYLKLLSLIKANEGKEFGIIIEQITTYKEHMHSIYLYKNNVLEKDIDIIAWDWGRATALIRWGYQVGYLSEVDVSFPVKQTVYK